MTQDILQGLNTQQQEAVVAGLGPVLVLAGPGSGKTRVLTQRIAFLIGSMGVSPYHILAVTFTNKAAREMEGRVQKILDERSRGVTLGTFHAVCAGILRREANQLPFNSSFDIFDANDQVDLVKKALQDLNVDEKSFKAQNIHASISKAKNDLLMPDDLVVSNSREEVVRRVYQRYQELLLANNALDFDDLLLWTARLLEEQPAVREKYARRYEHVLVDEFQDTNVSQYTLLRHLASVHRNIFVVGDTDQSIYRWRGADYRNVLRFQRDYPDTAVILLEQNYRSTQNILDIAMAVIDRNPQRIPKRLFTQRGKGQKAILHTAYDDREEAAFVIEAISTRIASRQSQPGDFAVMYRTNAQSRVLEEAFLHAGLPYKLVGAQRFYGRREIKDVIAYLRLVHNPNDEISLTRIINVPPRGIGDKTLNALRMEAQKLKIQPGELVAELARNPDAHGAFSGRTLSALNSFGSLLANWQTLRDELTPLALVDRILDDTDYHTYIDAGDEEGQDRWDNVMELRRLAAEHNDKGLEAFLEQVALVSDQDTLEAGANVPTLLTLHAAKGLEFPVVFIVGMNDGTLPHSRSFDDDEEMMEERRLLYVGITRARDLLYLINSENRSAFGYSEPTDPSRFLEDIPDAMVEHTKKARSALSSRGRDVSTQARWEPTSALAPKPPARPPQPASNQYQPGMKVRHPSWGSGMVLNTRLMDGDEIVDIFFEEIGLKRVAASLARLEIVNKA